MHLAWELVVTESHNLDEIDEILGDDTELWTPIQRKEAVETYLLGRRLHLNNAISLLQQSLELFLKAKIAEESPFLLIAGDVQSWPMPDASGNIDFSNFRTIDAIHLCKALRVVSKFKVTDEFVTFYDRIRKTRNKIAHLTASDVKAEVSAIMIDTLTAHKHLFPQECWMEFRHRFENEQPDHVLDGAEFTHDVLTEELDTVFGVLQPRHIKAFFGFDPKIKGLRCPECIARRSKHSDREWEFAQKQSDGTVRCAACLSVMSTLEYKERLLETIGQFRDQDELSAEVDRDLS